MASSDRLEVKIYISINSGSRDIKRSAPQHGNIVMGEENRDPLTKLPHTILLLLSQCSLVPLFFSETGGGG